jgi:hypothetical protein
MLYQTGLAPVNRSPLRGRYLSRSLGKREGWFVGADLYRGDRYLVEPSLEQAALLTGSKVSAVWWALRREECREAIIAGELPLVPPSVPKANGAPSVPVFNSGIDDAELMHIAHVVGAERMLAAAVAVENGQHY